MRYALFIRSNGLDLPVTKNQAGDDVVPLKPVTDLYGLNWSRQKNKVLNSERFQKMLKPCLALVPTPQGSRMQLCVDPVGISRFLFTLSLNGMRAGGNAAGADRLVERLIEMSDVLHANIMAGVAISKARATEPGAA